MYKGSTGDDVISNYDVLHSLTLIRNWSIGSHSFEKCRPFGLSTSWSTSCIVYTHNTGWYEYKPGCGLGYMIYQLDSCFDLQPISRLQTAYHSYPWRYGMTSQQITVTDGPRNDTCTCIQNISPCIHRSDSILPRVYRELTMTPFSSNSISAWITFSQSASNVYRIHHFITNLAVTDRTHYRFELLLLSCK